MNYLMPWFLLVIIIKTILTESDNECNNIPDCFTCTYSYSCLWENNQCSFDSQGIKQTDIEWHQSFPRYCSDLHSKDIISTFCSPITSASVPFSAKLIYHPTNSSPSIQSLYCQWKFEINPATHSALTVSFDSYGTMEAKYFYEVQYEEYTSHKVINTNSHTEDINQALAVIFHFYGREPGLEQSNFDFQVLPLKFTLAIEFVITLIIFAVIIVLFAGIGIGVCVYKKKHPNKEMFAMRRIQQENNSQNLQEQHQNQLPRQRGNEVESEGSSQEEDDRMERRHKAILNVILVSVQYDSLQKELDKALIIAIKCTICQEYFERKTKVTRLSCGHLFHLKCIQTWCYKSILNPKCPNCNYAILAQYHIDIITPTTQATNTYTQPQVNTQREQLITEMPLATTQSLHPVTLTETQVITIARNQQSNLNSNGNGNYFAHEHHHIHQDSALPIRVIQSNPPDADSPNNNNH